MSEAPWREPLTDDQLERLRRIVGAPSPIGYEAAMTEGVIAPMLAEVMREGWAFHRYRGNAGLVLDTHPGRSDLFTVMVVGHADKIRMQVRSIGDDGKIWLDSDSFLPCTLLGHEVRLFADDPKEPGRYRVLEGVTVEAVGAIHFAPPALRAGEQGIKPEMLYLELGLTGDERKAKVEALGIRPGNPVILARPLKRGFGEGTFYGAYLDNGLGCFVTCELARLVSESGGLKGVRVLFAIASHEEVGRLGSRVLAQELRPDVVVAVDVSHDYEAAPGIAERRLTPVKMGQGFTLSKGSIVSEAWNARVERACLEAEIPFQRRVVGKDTGNDAMAPFFASVDAAACAVGLPIRNMHTISECGHSLDVLSAIHGLHATLRAADAEDGGRGLRAEDLRASHIRLDHAEPLPSAASSSG